MRWFACVDVFDVVHAANVSAEFDDILEAAALSESVTHPFKNIMQARYRPQLITAVVIPFFQQFTGASLHINLNYFLWRLSLEYVLCTSRYLSLKG